MFRKLLIPIIALALFYCHNVAAVKAAGRMQIKEGDIVSLKIEALQEDWSSQWAVIDSEGNIVKIITSPFFNYTFKTAGRYRVYNRVLNKKTNETQTGLVRVEVKKPEEFQELEKILQKESTGSSTAGSTIISTPAADQDGNIHLPTKGGDITFSLQEIPNNFQAFIVDKDLAVDSNNDGDPANDADNLDHNSYRFGTPFTVTYDSSKKIFDSAVNLQSIDKRKHVQKFKILLDGGKTTTTSPVIAVLNTDPSASPIDQKIHLTDDEFGTIIFDGSASVGTIIEYRIDKNILVDSDQNGNPADDIDNRNDPSFKNGKNFQVAYLRTTAKIIAQLTVVTKEGRGSQIQREIVFELAPPFDLDFSIDYPGDIPIGQAITLTSQVIVPPDKKLIYLWDFNNDGQSDQETPDAVITHVFDQPGSVTIALTGKDSVSGETVKVFKTITVIGEIASENPEGKIKKTIADFTSVIDNNKVTFTDRSTPSIDLRDPQLQYHWDFGDNSTSISQNPIYVYPKLGNFIVTLKITDSAYQTATKSSEVIINDLKQEYLDLTPAALERLKGPSASGQLIVPPPVTPLISTVTATGATGEQLTRETATSNSLIWRLVKWLGLILLLLITLVAILFCGYIIYLKVKHPDFSFAECFQETLNLLKIKTKTAALPERVTTAAVAESAKKARVTEEEKVQVIDQEAMTTTKEKEEEVFVPGWLKKATDAPQTMKKDANREKEIPAPIAKAIPTKEAAATATDTTPFPPSSQTGILDEEIPDFLKEETPLSWPADDEIPDFLKEEKPKTSLNEEEIPDFLKEETPKTPPAADDIPDFLKEATPKTSVNKKEIPDFLKKEPPKTPLAPDDIPDFLKKATPKTSVNKEEIPDFIKKEAPKTTTAERKNPDVLKTTTTKPIEPEGKIPDFLKKEAAKTATAEKKTTLAEPAKLGSPIIPAQPIEPSPTTENISQPATEKTPAVAVTSAAQTPATIATIEKSPDTRKEKVTSPTEETSAAKKTEIKALKPLAPTSKTPPLPFNVKNTAKSAAPVKVEPQATGKKPLPQPETAITFDSQNKIISTGEMKAEEEVHLLPKNAPAPTDPKTVLPAKPDGQLTKKTVAPGRPPYRCPKCQTLIQDQRLTLCPHCNNRLPFNKKSFPFKRNRAWQKKQIPPRAPGQQPPPAKSQS